MAAPVLRFAPSPNGALHLGHALSALLNADMAERLGGRLLLRIEDIDVVRSSDALVEAILVDLDWLGIRFEPAPRRQSAHFDDYARALRRLAEKGLVYPAFLTRGEVRDQVAAGGGGWPRDPDGTPLYPGTDRRLDPGEVERRMVAGEAHSFRLNMDLARVAAPGPLDWTEVDAEGRRTGTIAAEPERWGDIILARKDIPTSYALSVVVDDALQGVTHVVRGMDLHEATSVQRLLQRLLGLPEPLYHHHRLMTDETGRKLSKSARDRSLAHLRAEGVTPADIRRMVGLA